MNKCVIRAVLLLYITISTSVTSLASNENLTPTLFAFEQLEGTFVQHRYISALPLPLESSGSFNYRRNRGITWATQRPIENTVIITTEGVAIEREKGSIEKIASSQMVAEIFLTVISGNLTQLESLFEIKHQPMTKGWQYTYTPKGAPLSQYISDVVVSGSYHVEKIDLKELNGDRTTIHLDIIAAD